MNIGSTILITCDNWFFAPDGQSYRAVWGTVKAVRADNEVLGLKTNARSTNWYVEIGNMVVAGCQIHYAIKCGVPHFGDCKNDDRGDLPSRIYNADVTI